MKITIIFLTVLSTVFLLSSAAPAPLLGIGKITRVLGNVVKTVGANTGEVIRQVGTITDNTVKHVTGKIVNDVKTTVSKIGKGVEAVKSTVQAKANCAEDSLKQLVYERIKISEEVLAKVIQTVKNALAKACDKNREGLTKVSDWLKSFKSLVTTVHDKLKKVVNGGSQAARDELVAEMNIAIKETKATLASFKNIPDAVKTVLNKGIGTILDNATVVVKALKGTSSQDSLKQLTYELIKSSEDLLAKVIKSVKTALSKASKEDREGLTQVTEWLKSFKSLVATIHDKLKKVVNGGSQAARDKVIVELNTAIEETKAALDSFTNIQEAVKAVLDKGIGAILANAARELEALKGSSSTGNSAEDSLKQLTYELIKNSEDRLAKVITFVRDACAKASDEDREGLTQVTEWLKSFKSLVATIHDKLKKVVSGGSQAARDKVIVELNTAIEETKAALDSFTNIQEAVKAVLDKGIGAILANAARELEALKGSSSTGNSAEDSLKQLTYELIKNSEDRLAKVITFVKTALSKASDEDREGLTQVTEWLKSFKSLVATIHDKLKKVVNGGSQAARDKVIVELNTAIEETKAALDSFKNITDAVKAVLDKGIGAILANAARELEALKGSSSTGNSAEDSLKQLTYELIKNSEDRLAKVITFVKTALSKASDEDREGLTQVTEWLKSFKSLVATIHDKLKKVVNGGSQAARDKVIVELNTAIEETKAALDSFTNIQVAVKAVLDKGIGAILANASRELEALKGSSSTGNSAEDSLKQLTYELIKSSEDLLAKVIKSVKTALSKASKEDREGLTQVTEWLKSFKSLVATIHDKLKKVVNGDSQAARDKVIVELNTAIEETKAALDSFTNIQEAVKAVLDKGIGAILANAARELEALKGSSSTGNSAEDSLKQLTYELIKSSEDRLAKVITFVKTALSKASDEDREGLTQVTEWLKSFKSLVATIHDKLKKVVNGGSQAARDKVIVELNTAIEETKAALDSFTNIQEAVKAVLDKGIGAILAIAARELEALKGSSSTGNSAEDSLKQLTYELIKSSEDRLAKVITFVKTALSKASDEDREGLTQVTEWLKSFKSLVATIHDKLKKVVNGGSQAARDKVIVELNTAIEETKAALDSFKNITDAVKAVLDKGIGAILANAARELEALKGSSSTGNSAEDSLKQLTYELIKSSEDLLAKVIKSVKTALSKASKEDREGLTQVTEWLKSFKSLVATIHDKLKKVVNGGSQAARDKVIVELNTAIEETKAALDSFTNIQEAVKAVLDKGIGAILANAARELEALKGSSSTGNSAEDSLKQLTYELIKNSEDRLAKVITFVKSALSKAFDEDREGLIQVTEWLKSFKSLVATIHDKLKKVVNGGSQAARDKVIVELNTAIEETKAALDSFTNIQEAVKAVLDKGIGAILANAARELEALKGSSSTGNSAEDSLKQLTYELIKSSEDRLAKVITFVKTALSKASDEDREGLTQVTEWLKSFKSLVATIHDKLKKVVNGGSQAARDKVIVELNTAIEETKAALDSFTNIQVAVKAVLDKGIGAILANAARELEALKGSSSTGNSAEDSLKQLTYELIKNSEDRLAKVITFVRDACAKASDEDREGVTQVTEWLKSFKSLVATIHDKLKKVVNGGSQAARDKVIVELNTAIEETKAALDSFTNIQEAVKAVLDKGIGAILANAARELEALKGSSSTGNSAEDSLKQLTYELIKNSEDRLAKVITFVKTALSKASDEDREGLTQVTEWLKSFKSLVAAIHDKLKKVVNGGSQAARDKVVVELNTAIEETKAALDSFTNIQEAVKAVLDKGIGAILANAARELEALKGSSSTGNSAEDSLKQLTYELIKNSEDRLAKVITFVKTALSKASDEDREGLTQVTEWLKSFKSLVATIHDKLKKVVSGGSQAARDKVIVELNTAIEETKAALDSFTNIQEAVKAVLDKGIGAILANAARELEALKGSSSTGNSAEDSLKQLTYELIKNSEDRLAKVITFVKTALSKASDEDREGLTQVAEWLKSFKSLVATIHDKLKKVVNGGSQAARDKVIVELNTAIEETKAALDSFTNIQEAVKAVLDKGIGAILANAARELEALKGSSSTGNSAEDSLKQLTYELIKNSEDRLAKVITFVRDACAKASDEDREGLTQVTEWLKSFKSLVATIHDKLKKVVNGGSQAARDKVIVELNTAIEETKAALDSFTNIQEAVKAVLDKGIGAILANAARELEALKGSSSTGNSAEDSLKQLTYELIKNSEDRLAKIITFVKTALSKASDEDIEGLTQVTEWLKSFKSLVATIHDKLKKVVNGGSQAARDKVIVELNTAIEETKAALDSFTNIQEAVKAVLDKGIGAILANAARELEALKGSSSTGNSAEDSLKQLTYELIKNSEDRLAKVITFVRDACAKASDEDREGLTQVTEWLKSFKSLVATIHDKLKKVINGGSQAARDKVIVELNTAIEETKAALDSFTNIQEAVKAVLDKGIGAILANAARELEALKGSSSTGNSAEDYLKELVYERIKISEEVLAKVIKAVKNALANASGEDRERLSQVTEWLNSFESLVTTVGNKLKEVVKGGCEVARSEVIIQIETAIEETKAALTYFENIPEDVNACLNKRIGTIIANAVDVIKALERENDVNVTLKQSVYERIESNAGALEEAKNAVANGLASTDGVENENLTEVSDWLNYLEELFLTLISELKKVVNRKSLEGRDDVVSELEMANQDTKTALASFDYIPEEVRNVLDEQIGIMLTNCDFVAEELSRA
ncbi:uncharacterized protein LOC123879330 [Maniola jurtina]|uniref:uncharacterized protein LOC123879330 n=1 Tax=Maniola jurtina TaxID=191418 RepID=UPI001E689224|nr:uncharacterized protein LOC123879330 [Maniola jurtina]